MYSQDDFKIKLINIIVTDLKLKITLSEFIIAQKKKIY